MTFNVGLETRIFILDYYKNAQTQKRLKYGGSSKTIEEVTIR